MVQFPHSSSVQSKMLHQVCYEHLEHLYLKDAKQQSWVESAGSSSFMQLPASASMIHVPSLIQGTVRIIQINVQMHVHTIQEALS